MGHEGGLLTSSLRKMTGTGTGFLSNNEVPGASVLFTLGPDS